MANKTYWYQDIKADSELVDRVEQQWRAENPWVKDPDANAKLIKYWKEGTLGLVIKED